MFGNAPGEVHRLKQILPGDEASMAFQKIGLEHK